MNHKIINYIINNNSKEIIYKYELIKRKRKNYYVNLIIKLFNANH